MNARPLSVVLLAAAAAGAQDFILYKFDGGCSSEVINYAHGPGSFRRNGLLESNTGASPWTTGRHRDALAGGDVATGLYNRVRTGWTPSQQPLLGDLTLAFWLREHTPTTALCYLAGTTLASGARTFTNGPAGRGLYQRTVVASGGNGASVVDLVLPANVVDVQARAAAGWTHVALVVDSAAATAEWYIDGASVFVLRNVGPARIATDGEYMIGFQGSLNESNYDQDDYLISRRAYSQSQIQALFRSPRAGDGGYALGVTGQCSPVGLRSYGGPPELGNANYGLELDAPAGFYLLGFGYNRCRVLGSPLPADFASFAPGCWLLTDPVATRGDVSPGPPVRVPMPIPSTVSYAGLQLFAQFLSFDVVVGGVGTATHASMGFAIDLGR